MAKNNVNIKIGSDTREAESGIKKVTGELNKLAKQINKSGARKLADSFNSFQRAGSIVTGALKKVNAAINECADLYEKQAKAETQLETAAKNNPYLNDVSVKQLKDYASQLQSISTTGDEELLPFMAQLAAAGRTQTEIQEIMSAALDVSASGVMSMESAVKNLNKTYSGLSGELGENIPQIKTLTTEQLKHGDAVKIVAEQYQGMAKATAEKTGGWTQFKNTMGDLKEAIGAGFSNAKNSAGNLLNTFLSSVVNGLTSANKEAEDFKKKIKAIGDAEKEGAGSGDIQNAIALLIEQRDKYQKQLDNLSVSEKTYTKNAKQAFEDFAKGENGYEKTVSNLEGKMQSLWYNIQNYSRYEAYTPKEYRKSLAELQLEYDRTREALAKYKNENEATYNTLKEDYKNSKKEYAALQKSNRNEDAKTLQQRIDDTNREIEEQQKRLTTAQELEASEAQALSTAEKKKKADETASAAKTKYYNTVNDLLKAQERERKEAELSGKQIDEQKFKQEELNTRIEAYVQAREEAGATISDNNAFVTQEIENIRQLKEELDSYGKSAGTATEETKGFFEKLKEEWSAKSTLEKFEYINNQMQSLISSFNDASSLMQETIDNEATADTANLEAQYEQGLISEEEYYDQKEKIEKKAAQRKYKLQLAEWALNLLATQSASALAIANTLSTASKTNATLAYIEAAVMGVQTAVQLASQIAAKPIPPSYETGGVVGGFSGATLGEDNVYIHARRGEMMLNAAQQKNLFDIANGSGASYSNNIFVKNEAGDVARANASVDSDGVQITIKRIVNDAMAKGEFNNSYALMKNNIYGRRITN